MKKIAFKKSALALITAMAAYGAVQPALAGDEETIEELKLRVENLEKALESVADSVEQQSNSNTNQKSSSSKIHLGGYGEMHYNNLSNGDTETRILDLHRMVLFVGYDFSDKVRFVSEFEVEHVLVSSGSRGAVEIEQAYVEVDINKNTHVKTGVMLMPIGIINETHEPPTFYGVERPVIETSIIPSTWYSAGIAFNQSLDNGLSYDVLVTEGLKTDDPNSNPSADPFYLKGGKQKASFADAFDLAVTGRAVYRGIAGLELAAYAQYQPDLDQSAEISYADSATLLGGHVIYQMGNITTKALYANWSLAGDDAAAAGKDTQGGGYLEVDYKASQQWGFFVRQSAWSEIEEQSATQTDFGVNFYPVDGVVFKADYQMQNDDAGNTDGFNLGVGYHF